MAFLTDPPAVLSTDTIEVYDSSDVHDALNSTYENLVSAIEDFQQRRSGRTLDKLIALDLHLLEFDPLRATSYIPLPTYIQNKDEKSLLWSVIAGLYGDSHAKNLERVSHYLEYEKKFNLQGIQFPKFERLNNISISVYAYQEGQDLYTL